MAQLPKILIFIDNYYPAYKMGGPIKSCRNFVEHMCSQYTIYIFTSNEDYGTDKAINVVPNAWKKGIRNEKVYYCSSTNFSVQLVRNTIKKIAPQFVYLNSFWSYKYSIVPLISMLSFAQSIKIILAPRGMLQQGALELKKNKKKLYLGIINLLRLYNNVFFQATDMQEKLDVDEAINYKHEVTIVPNFVSPILDIYKPIIKEKNVVNAIYLSRLDRKKNFHFLLDILLHIQPSIQFTLNVYGEIGDFEYWKQYCEPKLTKLPAHVQVHIHGAIQVEYVLEAIQKHHLFILTTLGENFGHAIFEALSVGRPVLISNRTPWQNLASQGAGWDLDLNNKNGFINAINEFATYNQLQFNTACACALNVAKDFLNNSDIKEQYMSLFE